MLPRPTWRRYGAIGAVALAFVVAGCRVSGDGNDGSYEVSGSVAALEVNAFGHVEVTAADGPVEVTESVHSLGGHPKPTHRLSNGTLRLDAGCSGHGLCEVDYKVQVPAQVAVTVNTVSGDVTVRGVSGNVKVVSKSGQVQTYSLSSPSTTIKASAGAVTLRYAKPPSSVDVHADAGAVSVQVPSGARYAVDTKAVFGRTNVDVSVDPSSSHKINVYARAGAIHISNN